MISDVRNTNKQTVGPIWHNELDLRQVYTKIVSQNLSPEQKDKRKNICLDIMEQLTGKPICSQMSSHMTDHGFSSMTR